MVATAAVQRPIPKPNGTAAFVDVTTGNLTQFGLTMLSQWHSRMVGTSRLIPCTASTTSNKITLTPLSPPPLLEKYEFSDIFIFTADATSTGPVTATVVPKSGTLATLKMFKTNGSAQADTGDIVSGLHYMASYSDSLDSGNGGLVRR